MRRGDAHGEKGKLERYRTGRLGGECEGGSQLLEKEVLSKILRIKREGENARGEDAGNLELQSRLCKEFQGEEKKQTVRRRLVNPHGKK